MPDPKGYRTFYTRMHARTRVNGGYRTFGSGPRLSDVDHARMHARVKELSDHDPTRYMTRV